MTTSRTTIELGPPPAGVDFAAIGLPAHPGYVVTERTGNEIYYHVPCGPVEQRMHPGIFAGTLADRLGAKFLPMAPWLESRHDPDRGWLLVDTRLCSCGELIAVPHPASCTDPNTRRQLLAAGNSRWGAPIVFRKPRCPTCGPRMASNLSGCDNPECTAREIAEDHAAVRGADQ